MARQAARCRSSQVSGRQALAALGAAGGEHKLATFCRHTGAKAMTALAHKV
jgi:hypothetical protein